MIKVSEADHGKWFVKHRRIGSNKWELLGGPFEIRGQAKRHIAEKCPLGFEAICCQADKSGGVWMNISTYE